MGEVARWIRAKPGTTGTEGASTFLGKVDVSEYLRSKYSGSPRPSATPLINEGGKIVGSSTVPGVPQRHAFFVRKNGKDPGLMTSQLRAFPKRKER